MYMLNPCKCALSTLRQNWGVARPQALTWGSTQVDSLPTIGLCKYIKAILMYCLTINYIHSPSLYNEAFVIVFVVYEEWSTSVAMYYSNGV